MLLHEIDHYGYSPSIYRECTDLIWSTNEKHVSIINMWFLIINVLFAGFSVLNMFGVNRSRISFYVIYGIVSLAFEICLIFFRKLIHKHPRITVYFSIVLLLSYCVSSSMAQPYLTASMFLVLVVLVALSYIDTMFRMTLVLSFFSLFFIWSSFSRKPESIAVEDTYNILVCLSLALVLHFTFQRARMGQFITYYRNIQIQHELEIQSSFDPLTSLLNRGRFFSMAGDVMKSPHDEYMAVCLLDLDGFKEINDVLGHQMGDKAIQIAGQTILNTLKLDMGARWDFQEKAMRERLSFAGRLGGDEFIVFLRGKAGREEVAPLLRDMLDNLNRVEIGELHGIHASFGVSEIEPENTDIDDIYRQADLALYESKRSGKNQIHFAEAGSVYSKV
ncbi:MAG: GGDEF domain-containing protein [Lachnospiraceae bacterium]|nr:GGDEF domain-containing protein [Lachnospiraceae bacterium]